MLYNLVLNRLSITESENFFRDSGERNKIVHQIFEIFLKYPNPPTSNIIYGSKFKLHLCILITGSAVTAIK
jgi:hypothetical protein